MVAPDAPIARGSSLTMDEAATGHSPPAEAGESKGSTVFLPGQNPQGEYILSVLLKRSYEIVPGGPCIRAETDGPVLAGDVFWGNPMNSTVRFESDFAPFKLATDVVVNGKAYAPGGNPTWKCAAAIQVGEHRKELMVIGDRKVQIGPNGAPVFTDPTPFTTMDLRYERAYGGIDVYSDKKTSYPYPRNPLGRGFIVQNTAQGLEELELPNIEDPNHLLTPDRLFVSDYSQWEEQPMPAGLGWFSKYWQPRAGFAGVMPADKALEGKLRKEYSAFVPSGQRSVYLENRLPDMDFRFFNGASPGLVFDFLRGDEKIDTVHLTPEGRLTFYLPGESPGIGLDIGNGLERTEPVIHTVLIHMEERRVDLVWRGAIPYPGPDWLVEMRKLEIDIS